MGKIGRYEIQREIGRGSMGVLYLAQDPHVRRRLALKTFVLPPGLSAEQETEYTLRFLREAQAAGVLSHPGIVTIYDAGTDPEAGLPYIAMEYVEGKSVRQLLTEKGRLPAEQVFAMAETLADALAAAHEAGIVHRDIKPANILVRNRDGAVKIVDFGVARLSTSDLTGVGDIFGSPAYMSPEQFRGQAVDGRSDLFSLAVILYQLLSGERPFAGEDLSSLAYTVVHTTPPSLSSRIRGFSPALDRFFDRAFAKNPADRFPDGHAFRRALVQARQGGASGGGIAGRVVPLATQRVKALLSRAGAFLRNESLVLLGALRGAFAARLRALPRAVAAKRPAGTVGAAVGEAAAGKIVQAARPPARGNTPDPACTLPLGSDVLSVRFGGEAPAGVAPGNPDRGDAGPGAAAIPIAAQAAVGPGHRAPSKDQPGGKAPGTPARSRAVAPRVAGAARRNRTFTPAEAAFAAAVVGLAILPALWALWGGDSGPGGVARAGTEPGARARHGAAAAGKAIPSPATPSAQDRNGAKSGRLAGGSPPRAGGSFTGSSAGSGEPAREGGGAQGPPFGNGGEDRGLVPDGAEERAREPRRGAGSGTPAARLAVGEAPVARALNHPWTAGGTETRRRKKEPSPAAAAPVEGAPEETGEPAPIATLLPPPEPASPRTDETGAWLMLNARSRVKQGRMVLFVDGNEVFSRDLSTEKAEESGTLRKKKWFQRKEEAFETRIGIPPGRHEVMVRIIPEGKDAVYEDRTTIEVAAAQSLELELLAGKVVGPPVTIKTNQTD